MLLFNNLRLAQNTKSAGHENRARIARAKRFERAQFLRKLKSERVRRNFPIDIKLGQQVFISQTRRRMFIQATAEFGDGFTTNRQSSSVRMAAKLVQQISTRRKSIKQVIGFNAPRRTVTDIAFERDNYARAM